MLVSTRAIFAGGTLTGPGAVGGGVAAGLGVVGAGVVGRVWAEVETATLKSSNAAAKVRFRFM